MRCNVNAIVGNWQIIECLHSSYIFSWETEPETYCHLSWTSARI